MMTTEDLMKPRYKVIADYPGSNFEIGSILIQDLNTIGEVWLDISRVEEKNTDRDFVLPEYINKYPHLFKPLAWWEERKVEDMPEYVSCDKFFTEVFEWRLSGSGMIAHTPHAPYIFHAEQLSPATLTEYNDYITHSLPNQGRGK